MRYDATGHKIVTYLQAFIAALIFAGIAPNQASAEAVVSLSPDPRGCQLVQTTLKADGKLVVGTDTTGNRPIRVVGDLRYFDLRSGQGDGPHNSTRHYATAKATISVDGRVTESRLEDARRLIFVRQAGDRLIFYSPAGPLTRGDLDLVSVQCDPLVIQELLDGKSAELNQAWKASNEQIGKLFSLDNVIDSTVTLKLLSATSAVAELRIKGDAEGTALGATSKLKLEGTIRFDRTRKQVSRIEMTIHENRDVGLFSPGFEIEAHIDTSISPSKPPQQLNKEVWAKHLGKPTASQLAIDFASSTMGVAFIHDRDWRVTLHRQDLLVLRMVREGKFIAQCNIVPGSKVSDDPKADAAKFQSHVEQALAKNAGQIEEISTATTDSKVEIVRIAAKGIANEVPINWIYYMLTSPNGKRAAIVFTLAQDQKEEFANADHDLIGALRFAGETRSAQRIGATER